MELREFIINLEVLLALESKKGFVKSIIRKEDINDGNANSFTVHLCDGSKFDVEVNNALKLLP